MIIFSKKPILSRLFSLLLISPIHSSLCPDCTRLQNEKKAVHQGRLVPPDDLTRIGFGWFSNWEEFEEVIIPGSVFPASAS